MKYYGISQVGKYHLDEGSDVCQDSFAIRIIDENTIVAAVADGVGSEKHSEIASKIATSACVNYCKEFYYKIEDKVVLLSNSFQEALFSIQDKSKESGIEMNQLDCTLCAVILTNDNVVCGNVGDSGAIGLSTTGEYILLTEQQNDENGAVYPLASQSSWQFYKMDEELVSVLLATDGFYNFLFPRYLAVDWTNRCFMSQKILDYETVSRYIDPNHIALDQNNQEIQTTIEQMVNSIPREGGWDGIIDDLTVVGLITGKQHETNLLYTEPIDRDTLKTVSNEITNEMLYGRKDKPEEMTKQEPDSNNDGGLLISSLPPIDIIPQNKTIEEKIQNLINRRPPRNILNKMEWPTLIIRNGKGQYHGYVKTHIGRHEMISDFMENEENVQKITRRANVAFNLASLLKDCHENGIIAGITGTKNIAVGDKREVYFLNLDIDLINLTNSEQNIPITLLESLDPGFETKHECVWMTVKQMEESLLSLLIFKLFFNNSSPFRKDDENWIYVDDKDEMIPNPSLFPEYITALFERAFNNTEIETMPQSYEWFDALNKYSEEVTRCVINEGHVYYRLSKECPYCRCKTLLQDEVKENPIFNKDQTC